MILFWFITLMVIIELYQLLPHNIVESQIPWHYQIYSYLGSLLYLLLGSHESETESSLLKLFLYAFWVLCTA